MEVEWSRTDEVFPVILSIETEDKPGILARLTEAIAKYDSNIRQIEADTEETGRGLIQVVVEVRNRKHLEKVSQAVRGLEGVRDVHRPMGNR
ncbi:MAG: ACT domain-containing protein [Thermoanaerobaculia bacterium]